MDDPRRLTSTDTGSRPLSFDIYEGSIQKYKTEVDENGDAGIVFCGRTGVGSGSIVATFRGERDGWPFPSSVKLGGARDFIKAENWLVPNQSLPMYDLSSLRVPHLTSYWQSRVHSWRGQIFFGKRGR